VPVASGSVDCTIIRPTAAETSRTAKFLTTIRSAVEGGQGQAAAAAFIKWQDGDGESLDIDTDLKPVVSISDLFIISKKEKL
jgi:hypothetical protein